MASILRTPNSPPLYLPPTEVYTLPSCPNAPIRLRIATGGAGQSGLIRALSLAFIAHQVSRTSCAPFSIAWCASDTSLSFNSLALGAADVAITYHPAAERIALLQGIAARRVYAWRDHWLLVGPVSNPANLPLPSSSPSSTSIHELLTALFIACTASFTTPTPIKFLSRFDKSAANILESRLWTEIGQTPWAHPYSTWYHRFVSFPLEALTAAAKLGEYTITDRGSWLSVDGSVRAGMRAFCEGGDRDGEVMLNPAHALVGAGAVNAEIANAFVEWIEGEGQEVIRTFRSKDGVVLYSAAPGKGERAKL